MTQSEMQEMFTAEQIKAIKSRAEAELDEEKFRNAVECYKHKLRARKNFWNRIFPWKIIFVRKELI